MKLSSQPLTLYVLPHLKFLFVCLYKLTSTTCGTHSVCSDGVQFVSDG